MTYKLLSEERETTVNYNEADAFASVITSNAALIKKLRNTNAALLRDEKHFGVMIAEFKVPKTWIKISPPRQSNLSETQKNAAAERLRESRKNRPEP